MLNKFLVAGRMTADPEIKTVGENRLCKFTIACDRPKRKGEETAETDFFPCTAWNRNADVIVDWFGKGDMVTLVGSVHNNRYEKDGQKHSSIEVKVEEIHFSGGKKKQEWDDREEAQAYFLEAMMNSDGAEHDRYSCIFIQLQNGLSCCTDEDDEEDE